MNKAAANRTPDRHSLRANPQVAGLVRMDDFITDERNAAVVIRNLLTDMRKPDMDWQAWAEARHVVSPTATGEKQRQAK
jgi:hypothetical protein